MHVNIENSSFLTTQSVKTPIDQLLGGGVDKMASGAVTDNSRRIVEGG